MRLIKMLGLAAVAAVAAMAFVGATSALAADTQLCNSHSALTCGSAATGMGMNNSGQGVGILLNTVIDVLCLTISGSGTPLGLANPQSIHITALSFTNCGTKSAHNNCTVSVLELPLANLNKTGLDTGTIEGTNGLVLLICDNIDIFGIDNHCIYDATGATFSVGAQHLTASDTPVNVLDDVHCLGEEPSLDGLLKTTANRYVLA